MKTNGSVKPIDEQNPASELGDLIPRDTTLEAYRFQIEVLRKLGEEGRFKIMLTASANLRYLTADGVRMRHPDYNDEQIRLAVTRLMVGEEVFKKLVPWSNIQP